MTRIVRDYDVTGATRPTRQVATDLGSGMEVDIDGARHIADHREMRYSVCCPGCKGRFEKRPGEFLYQSKDE